MANRVVLVIASKDYQPIEYSVSKKILEHSGIIVTTASEKAGTATASDGTTTDIDVTIDAISFDDYDALFVIGGKGSLTCLDTPTVHDLLKRWAATKKPFGAICTPVRILAKSGVLEGKRATGWNGDGELDQIFKDANATYIKKDVVVDGNIVTAVGPTASQEFGAKILSVLAHE